MSNTLSVKELAGRFAVTTHTVLSWIARGELHAINVGRHPASKRPRWRVTQEALAAFESARASRASQGQGKAPRRKRAAEVINFY
jgi:excisionase family DNA binding protein